MIEFLKKLFLSKQKYSIGSIENPHDIRNIDIAQVQTPIEIPKSYKTDLKIFGVDDQSIHPACVGFSFAKYAEYLIFKIYNVLTRVDGLDLYRKAKKEDGIPTVNGTYPVVIAKIVVRDGITDKEGKTYKIATGYAFVQPDIEAIKQAIYQNGVLSAGFLIDGNWFKGIITKVLKWIGGHQVLLYGYDSSIYEILHGQNSWNYSWVGKIAGFLDRNVSPGCFEAKWEDVQSTIMNIMALTEIPKEIIDNAKKNTYRFMKTLKLGSEGYDVKKLQEILGLSADGKFGKKTEEKVKQFQIANNLGVDGMVGINTRIVLNKTAPSLIPVLAEAIKEHEGYIAPNNQYPKGSPAWRNKNPANFIISRRDEKGNLILTEYMIKLGAIDLEPTKDGKRAFVIFPSYEVGFKALCTFLEDACNGKLSSYSPNMTIFQFFGKYAPSFENDTLLYSKTVAKKVGGSLNTEIRELL